MDAERRYRRLGFSQTLLTDLFRSMMQGERVLIEGLPADVVFRWFYVDPASNTVYAVAESAEFPPTAPGADIPGFDWSVNMEEGRLVGLKAWAWR